MVMKRSKVIQELYETEKTYVKKLNGLVSVRKKEFLISSFVVDDGLFKGNFGSSRVERKSFSAANTPIGEHQHYIF